MKTIIWFPVYRPDVRDRRYLRTFDFDLLYTAEVVLNVWFIIK
jgi:hypothetical protein